MTFFGLPYSLTVEGEEWDIRTDFRDILNIISAFNDPNLEDAEKALICLQVLYVSFNEMPDTSYNAAFTAALKFMDCEMPASQKGAALKKAKTMDWEQDSCILFPAINKVAGYEVRDPNKPLHWWTFMGYYMEISTDGVFGTVLRLRQKRRNKNTPLDKSEREFWAANKELCEIKERLSDEEIAEKERLKALLG